MKSRFRPRRGIEEAASSGNISDGAPSTLGRFSWFSLVSRPLPLQSASLPNLLFPVILSSNRQTNSCVGVLLNTALSWAPEFQRELAAVLKRAWQCEGRNVVASTKRQLVSLHKHSIHTQIITCPWNSGAGKLCLVSHKRPTTDLTYGFERSQPPVQNPVSKLSLSTSAFPVQVEVLR
jgi:hypothetical protein